MASVSYTKILFVGDMHLGKRPPTPELDHFHDSFPADNLGPQAAWEAIVKCAITENVDAVALAGDLVDSDEDLFEARALLENGIEKLTRAGIGVCAVAGNHDTLIMPQLARSIPELKLLGPHGQWSEYLVSGDGADVRLAGWSFPGNHHSTSPLSTPPAKALPGVITLGLLHCDLGSKRSKYAPVSVAELQATGYQAWFLGHIHQPGPVPDFTRLPATPFYLGSITGLDRNETGIHGPVLVAVANDGTITGRRIPLAPLHWDYLDVPVSSLFPVSGGTPWETILRNHLMEVLDRLPHWDDPDLSHTKALGLSVTLTGKVEDPHGVALAVEKLQQSDQPWAFSARGRAVFIKKLIFSVTGLADLQKLAQREDPPGLLARQILILKNPEGSFSWTDDAAAEARHLVSLGRKELQKLARETTTSALSLNTAEHDEATIARMMVHTGNRLLDGLLAQGRSNNASS